MQIQEVILNSGHSMPLIGMGTAADPLPPPENLTSIIIDAIAAGYRHFDTAALYSTEEPLGRAVAEALKRDLIKDRDEVFITSKLWCSDADHDLVLPALKESLRKLGLNYVDLYLIHWPVRIKPGINHFRFSKDDILPFDMKGTWKAMEECCKLGLAKSVGLSNFSCAKIERLLQHATIPPAVNQVEMNVAWQQQKMLEFCREKGIHVSAWSPLGANGAYWGSHRVLKSPVLQKIAAAKGKTVAQVALRWIHEEGASIIVKSFNNERMRENLDILDWKLTDEEVKQIKQISQCRGLLGQLFLHENGPYKTLEQLWDGEI
ncbi:Aldo/keto reductase family protein [Handroanthus impetiginosus]|uniref:Aldo/keto reductase family protein n=1 Tax=Handroanthus impetiginosus TaxID=429701 RepID=A0A2G9HMJ1_9LAMI|nr:Aldo/keto reductase family protein [Handroanthus impetiginosus]